MFFVIKNKKYVSSEQLKNKTLLNAYYIITRYPLHAADVIMDQHIKQQYNTSLKNMCVQLLLNLTYYKNNSGDIILIFKDPKHDAIARLITFGNGAIPGSKILQTALKD